MPSFSCDCPYSPEDLEEVLTSRKFNGIGQLDVDHLGWINPKEIESAPLVHVVDSIYFVALQKESKIVPASRVKKKLAAAMAEAEKREGRPATRKERKALKDQVYESLLPGAMAGAIKRLLRSARAEHAVDVETGSEQVAAVNQLGSEGFAIPPE